MKAVWINDIHLEFLEDIEVQDFFNRLRNSGADCVLLAGDIAQAPTVEEYLVRMEHELECPIYFVLGNHDFYHGSIAKVRARIKSLTTGSCRLRWMNAAHVVQLAEGTVLIGHDGWGDGGYGDFHGSHVKLNDFLLIKELARLCRNDLLKAIRALGAEAAAHFRNVLPEALSRADHVVVLTHVSPFIQSCWHDGRPSNSDWLPFFACKAVGDVLKDTMQEHPTKRMTVLCGHTHGGGSADILPNLVVHTGPAEYGRPIIQKVFEWH